MKPIPNHGKRDVKLYNVLFPLWMILLFPQLWLIVLPGNFLIDSLVFMISMLALKMESKKQYYKKYILKIYLFGMLADLIGAGYMLLMVFQFHIGGPLYDAPIITVPALLISAVLIFVANYFVTFRPLERALKIKLALIFAIVTAPYTFLIPSNLLYGWS